MAATCNSCALTAGDALGCDDSACWEVQIRNFCHSMHPRNVVLLPSLQILDADRLMAEDHTIC